MSTWKYPSCAQGRRDLSQHSDKAGPRFVYRARRSARGAKAASDKRRNVLSVRFSCAACPYSIQRSEIVCRRRLQGVTSRAAWCGMPTKKRPQVFIAEAHREDALPADENSADVSGQLRSVLRLNAGTDIVRHTPQAIIKGPDIPHREVRDAHEKTPTSLHRGGAS